MRNAHSRRIPEQTAETCIGIGQQEASDELNEILEECGALLLP
jgi:hypothetical protein